MIADVSFIIIARNESFAIRKCLDAIASMPQEDCQVICVDSDSTDNTLEVMKAYTERLPNYTILHCTGYVNAAVARNVGLKHATKRYIFFADGDVELNADFVREALIRIELGEADAAVGRLIDAVYDPGYKNEIRRTSDRYHIRKEGVTYFSGGILLARSSTVAKAGNWDEYMIRSQDIDFSLRLSRHGRFVALPSLMGVHHTLEYQSRPWHYIINGYPVFYGIVIRRNLDRPRVVLSFLEENLWLVKGWIAWLSLMVLLLIAWLLAMPVLCYVWLALVFADQIWGTLVRRRRLVPRVLEHYVWPIVAVRGLFPCRQCRHATTRIETVSINRQSFAES
jgi:GT2 family glycosyltransferase